MRSLAPVLALCLLLVGVYCPVYSMDTLHPDDPLRLLARLAFADQGRPWQFSSYDRTGGNDDGFSGAYSSLREIEFDDHVEYVVLETDEPGVLGNIWFTGDVLNEPDRRIRFYFDEDEGPGIDMTLHDFFSGNFPPFVAPLVGDNEVSSGGFVNAMVIAWEKRLLVTTTKLQRFFHFTGRSYDQLPPGYTTFDPLERSSLNADHPDVFRLLNQPGQIRPDGPGVVAHDVSISVPPRGSKPLARFVRGGLIQRIEMNVSSRDGENLRRSLLKMYWDGESNPSVEVPIGDFFGCGFGLTFFESVPFGSTLDGLYSNWPMPFANSAHIVVDNGSSFSDLDITARIYVLEDPTLVSGSNILRFHAKWHRATTEHGKPHLLLEARGTGHYVGTYMAMQGSDFGFMEGDEQLYVDGSEEPVMHGTGTEDYFNGGWYFDRGTFALPYHGLTVKDESNHRIAAYRLHIPDILPFQSDLRFQIEHGPGNDRPGADYASVAYWYQTQPHVEPPFRVPPATEIVATRSFVRLPSDVIPAGEMMEGATAHGSPLTVRPISDANPAYAGADQLFFEARWPGHHFTVPVNTRWDDRYLLDVGHSRGPHYGPFEVLVDGDSLAGAVQGYSAHFIPNHETTVGPMRITAQDGAVTFRTRSIQASGGLSIGLQYIRLRPASAFVTNWMVIGPFDINDQSDLDRPYIPEEPLEFDTPYPGAGGRTLSWREMDTAQDGRLDLNALGPPQERVAALCYTGIHSPKPYRTKLLLGSDDGAVVVLNGHVVHRFFGERVSTLDEDVIDIDLRQGWNNVLIKVGNERLDWKLAARVADPEGILRYSPRRE